MAVPHDSHLRRLIHLARARFKPFILLPLTTTTLTKLSPLKPCPALLPTPPTTTTHIQTRFLSLRFKLTVHGRTPSLKRPTTLSPRSPLQSLQFQLPASIFRHLYPLLPEFLSLLWLPPLQSCPTSMAPQPSRLSAVLLSQTQRMKVGMSVSQSTVVLSPSCR